jgi:hypothetical protein
MFSEAIIEEASQLEQSETVVAVLDGFERAIEEASKITTDSCFTE